MPNAELQDWKAQDRGDRSQVLVVWKAMSESPALGAWQEQLRDVSS